MMKMMNRIGDSRKGRVVAASISGIVFSVISLLLSFVLRTVFLDTIGVEYLGLFSFLAEFIGLLSAVDGGVCSSLFIKIHQPIARKDNESLAETFRLIRIVYALRALLVLVVGFILFFFLHLFALDQVFQEEYFFLF